jgi:hypothetical protein
LACALLLQRLLAQFASGFLILTEIMLRPSPATQGFNPILEPWPKDPIKGQQTVCLIGSALFVFGILITVFFVKEGRPEEDLVAVDREYEQYIEQQI